MRRLQPPINFGFIALPFLLIHPVVAESFEERHATDLATNPADLYFRLSTPNPERRFHMGERIPITLEFSSSSTERYKLNGATYDRSGRLPTEEFVPDREDVTDPYRDFFGTGVLGGLAGGIRTYPVLESKPYSINLELNDWFRFDRPGRYRMYLRSHRLTRERLPGETGEKIIQFAAISNILEIEILPEDAGWEATKLSEIRMILDQPEPERPRPGGPPVPHNPLEEKIALARRELRYLGTNAAVQLMFDRAGSEGAELDTLALIGARDRAQTVARFDRYLADPEVGFREWDIRVRALFTFLKKDAPQPVPTFAWQIPNSAGWEKIWQTLEGRQKRFEDLARAEAIRLTPLAVRKTTVARKASAEAIAAIAGRGPSESVLKRHAISS